MARRHLPFVNRPPLPDFEMLDDVALLQFAGEAMFGPHWRRYLPERLGVSESYLVALSRKKEGRTLTTNMRRRLLDVCACEPARLIAHAKWQADVLRRIQIAMERRTRDDE